MFKPLVIQQSLLNAFPEDNKGFDCKIFGQALQAWSALQHKDSLGWSEGQAQTQVVS